MAAPAQPRFTVGSVTGYPIKADKWVIGSHPSLVWGVRDSAYCHALIQEFRGINSEVRARRFAVELEALHAEQHAA